MEMGGGGVAELGLLLGASPCWVLNSPKMWGVKTFHTEIYVP